MHKSLHLEDIPYCPDVGQLFAPLRELPGAALLDSAFPFASCGRYDILTALPVQTLSTPAPGSSEQSYRQFYSSLHSLHSERYADVQPPTQELPFCGGLLGCWCPMLLRLWIFHALAKSTSPTMPSRSIWMPLAMN